MKITQSKVGFEKYYQSIFGNEPKLIPEFVYLIHNDDLVIGFVSGHKNFDGLFYIEHAGILPDFQKLGYVRYLKSAFDHIGGGFVTAVNNENKETIRILVAADFKIVGFKTICEKSYIEFMRQ